MITRMGNLIHTVPNRKDARDKMEEDSVLRQRTKSYQGIFGIIFLAEKKKVERTRP